MPGGEFHMDKAATFFRVFDIAFFAPGAVLFAAVWRLDTCQRPLIKE